MKSCPTSTFNRNLWDKSGRSVIVQVPGAAEIATPLRSLRTSGSLLGGDHLPGENFRFTFEELTETWIDKN